MQNFLWRGQSLKVPREGQSSIIIQDCWMNEFQKKCTGSGESSERWAPTSSTGRLLVTRYTIPNQDPAASDFSNRTGFALNPRRGDCWVSRNEYTPHYLYVRNLHSQVRHLVNTCSFQKSKYSFALNPRRRGDWWMSRLKIVWLKFKTWRGTEYFWNILLFLHGISAHGLRHKRSYYTIS